MKMSLFSPRLMKKKYRRDKFNDEKVFHHVFVRSPKKSRMSIIGRNFVECFLCRLTDTLSTSVNTTQEDISTSTRITKNLRSQTMNTAEPKTAPPRSSTSRKTRVNRARSEDRFRSSTLSLNNATGDTTSSSSSHSHLPSYAAHTSSSMNKLREGTTTTSLAAAVPAPVLASASSTTSLAMTNQPRRVPSVPSLDTRSKLMTKSRSTQNLILPMTASMQPTKTTTLRRVKISRVSRRPPNLPTTTNQQLSTSSSSSNTSSPTKTNQTKENDQSKQYPHPNSSSILSDSILPLRPLDNTSNDLMPKWAQDCFYRTVVLGLKPLLLEDIPGSPSRPTKRSSSACSIESSDSLETTSELQACTLNDEENCQKTKEMHIHRSLSTSDYRPIKQGLPISLPSLEMNDPKEE